MTARLIGTLLLFVLVPGCLGQPADAGGSRGMPTPPRALTIADFDADRPQGTYGELVESCPPSLRGAVRFAVEPAERCGHDGGCLHLRYAFGEPYAAPAGFRIDLQGLDASGFDHLAFWVKGDAVIGHEAEIQVGFRRPDPVHRGLTETATTMVRGISGEWQLLVVRLGRMTGIRDWSNLRHFIIVFDPRRTARKSGAFYVDDITLLRTGEPGPRADDPVVPAKKRAWEAALGGRRAAQVAVKARLVGWPARLLAEPPSQAAPSEEFLLRLAHDTWRGLDALTDREHGLPLDHVRFNASSIEVGDADIGDYTSPTDVGLHLISIVAAHELDLLSQEEALGRLHTTLRTLEGLETFEGFFFNYYDTVSLERTSNFVSFVDSAWLTAGLIVVRNAFPRLSEPCTRLIERGSYRLFYDDVWQAMSHGYYVNVPARSQYHYGVLYTESRIGNLIAIGKGDVPEEHWFKMKRIFPAACGWQTRRPMETGEKNLRGCSVRGGYYEWNGYRYVPSWGGSMFEGLMPTLVLDERAHAPASLGRNDVTHAVVQRRYALEQLGYPVWGVSPSASPHGGYGEYGIEILGSRGYRAGAVTPHAAALALSADPDAAVANLRRLTELYPIYGEYGLYDSVDPASGEVGHAYLALDQSMILISIANHLQDHCIQRHFATDPIVQRVLPIIADEDFFN